MSEAHPLPASRPQLAWRGRRRGWPQARRDLVGRRRRGDPNHPTRIGLWLPLTPLWLLLGPFALLFAPLLSLAPAARGVSPYRAAFAVGAVLLSLSGTVVEVDAPGATIRIRIF